MNKLTPKQAYKKVELAAQREGVTLALYCAQRGVSQGTISKWKNEVVGRVSLDTLDKLEIDV